MVCHVTAASVANSFSVPNAIVSCDDDDEVANSSESVTSLYT